LVLRWPLYDYVAFWAAGRLNQMGCDPYDTERLAVLQRQACPEQADVLVMWPAPWALTLIAPFSAVDSQSSHLAWLLLLFVGLVAAVEAAWRVYGGDPEQRWLAWLVTFTFLPAYFVLVTGQLSGLVLLGFAGFLWALRRGRHTLAGACLALAAMKPQLTYLFWIALLLWAWEGRRWRLVLGGFLGVGLLLAWPLASNPSLLGHYIHALTQRTQTHAHVSPLLGTALVLLAGQGRFGLLQFVPALPGLVWLGWYWRRHRVAWNWHERLPALLFASFLTASYGAWPFDLVILLLPLLQRTAQLQSAPRGRQAAVFLLYLVINLLALAQILAAVEYFWFLWMTPALLAAYLLTGRQSSPQAGLVPT
jgi:hypothetical protein